MPFCLQQEHCISFDDFFKLLGLNSDELKTVTITVWMHYSVHAIYLEIAAAF